MAQAVIAAARQYFQAAQSADSEEMALAQLCLAALPKHTAAQHELASIRALQELQYFGVHLTPAEYQQASVEEAMASVALQHLQRCRVHLLHAEYQQVACC